ncbi:MAG: TIR domain-containing protein [Planctomycetaceae bacterium]
MRLFISYNRDSGSNYAEFLLSKIDSEDEWESLIDIEPSVVTNDYWDDLVTSLKFCDCVLFVATRGACDSDECKAEVRYAKAENRPVIICEFEKIESYPRGFESFHIVEFHANFSVGWDRLRDVILAAKAAKASKPSTGSSTSRDADNTESTTTSVQRRPNINITGTVFTVLAAFVFGGLSGAKYFSASPVAEIPAEKPFPENTMKKTEGDAPRESFDNEFEAPEPERTLDFLAMNEECAGIIGAEELSTLPLKTKDQLLREIFGPEMQDKNITIKKVTAALTELEETESAFKQLHAAVRNAIQDPNTNVAIVNELTLALGEIPNADVSAPDPVREAQFSRFAGVKSTLGDCSLQLANANHVLAAVRNHPQHIDRIIKEIRIEDLGIDGLFVVSVTIDGGTESTMLCQLEVRGGVIENPLYERRRREMELRGYMDRAGIPGLIPTGVPKLGKLAEELAANEGKVFDVPPRKHMREPNESAGGH